MDDEIVGACVQLVEMAIPHLPLLLLLLET